MLDEVEVNKEAARILSLAMGAEKVSQGRGRRRRLTSRAETDPLALVLGVECIVALVRRAEREALADARETARREALEEAAKIVEAEGLTSVDLTSMGACLRDGRIAKAIRALSHPDREGERPSEAETAARIVDTQAQYYAGHNDDIAKALKEAAGAIRVQVRPGREGERG